MLLRSGKPKPSDMPVSRSPQRPQQSNDPDMPAVENQEPEQNTSDTALNSQATAPIENPSSMALSSLEQVSSYFTRQFEEMQLSISRQMSAIQSMVETNNLQIRDSISSLQREIHRPEDNNAIQVSTAYQPTSDFNNVTRSSPNSANMTSIPTIHSSTTPAYASSYSIPCFSTATVSTPPHVFVSANNVSNSMPQSTNSNPYISLPTISSQSFSVPQSCSVPQTFNSSAHFPMPTVSSQALNTLVPHRQKKIYALPKFSGSPEEWQTFLESFQSTTAEFEYSDLHNIMRLRDSLGGKARETVESLLTNSRNVNSIMNILSETYGRPEQLIKSQIQKVRSLTPVNESDLNALISYANKVTNMTTFIQSVGGEYHLSNPILLSELLSKLPVSKRIQWAEKCLSMGHVPSIIDFSSWLQGLGKIINMVSDSLPADNSSFDKKSKRYACTSTSVDSKQCKLCGKGCKSLAVCEEFSALSLESRWEKVKSMKVCFSCLKSGHQAPKCFSKKRCNTNSCQQFHHRLLHKDRVTRPSTEPSTSSQSQALNLVTPYNVESSTSNQAQARNCLVDVNTGSGSVLFQVIPVRLYGSDKSEVVYAFVDDGANVSMIDGM